MPELIQGIVERIVFRNPDNGFSVLRLTVSGQDELVTVVGNSSFISVSENIECAGEWHHDKVYGRQFKTSYFKSILLNADIANDSTHRAKAGVLHALQAISHQGHCAIAYQDLIKSSMEQLEMPEGIIQEAIALEITEKKLILEKINGMDYIFPIDLYHAESNCAEDLLRILKGSPPWGKINTATTLPRVEKKTGLQLADSQKQAIEIVLKHKVTIITGGPGVGKTTIVNTILKILQSKKMSVGLCAPTGRAAKRLMETTGLTAKTIHRLLGINPETHSFKHDEANPLPIDVLVVDEVSMVDVVLFKHLLSAIPDHAALLLVGDVDQLPSVGPGAVLMDLIRSGTIPTVRLTEIFRQAANSNIIFNAHRINQGELPLPNESIKSDFYTIYADNPHAISEQLIELVSKRLPEYVNCNPMTDIQVLTPMNRGLLGSIALNSALQKKLNGEAEPKVTRSNRDFAPGDKVIQTINNYEKDVFNGDIGFITQVDLTKNLVRVSFDNRFVEYDFNELEELNLAYAISIHKAQGSEFKVVVMVLSTQHYRLLARNLLYTGVTRGKQLVVLITDKKAVRIAVNNNRENERLTKLAERLKEDLVKN